MCIYFIAGFDYELLVNVCIHVRVLIH